MFAWRLNFTYVCPVVGAQDAMADINPELLATVSEFMTLGVETRLV